MALEHKPLPVAGYTTQNEDNLALVAECKELEERVLRYLDRLERLNGERAWADTKPDRIDRRHVALARTNIQNGFMWAVRSVFQPQRIKLPGDDA